MKYDPTVKPETFVSKDATRPHMTRVQLDADAQKLVATDGHRMIVTPIADCADDHSGPIDAAVASPVAALYAHRRKPMEPITLQQYANECSDIARELVDECNADEEQMHDRLHETIDGHQWIIYTYYNLQVVEHSKNEDAYFEDFGPLTADSFSQAMQRMAFAAFMRDVEEEIPGALERWRKEHPEAGDAGEPDPDFEFEKSQDR